MKLAHISTFIVFVIIPQICIFGSAVVGHIFYRTHFGQFIENSTLSKSAAVAKLVFITLKYVRLYDITIIKTLFYIFGFNIVVIL